MLKNKTILTLVILAVLLNLASGLCAASGIVYDPGNRRDPFVPLTDDENTIVTGTSSSGGIKLEGIIYDPGERSMAILNGNTYRAGEVLGNTTVVKILKDHVVILIRGEEKTLWIREKEKT